MLNNKGEKVTLKKSLETIRQLFRNVSLTFGLLWSVDKRLTLASFGFELLSQLESIALVYLFKLMIDNTVAIINKSIAPELAIKNLALYLFLNFSFGTIMSVVNNYARMVDNLFTEKILVQVNYRLMSICNRLQMKFFEDPDFFDKYEKVRRNSQNRPIRVYYSLLRIFGQFFLMASFLSILFAFQPLILILIILGVFPLFIFDSFFARKLYFITDSRVPQSRLVQYLSSMLFSEYNTKELRIFGLHKYFHKMYQDTAEKFYRENKKVWQRQSIKRIPLQLISQVSSFAGFAYIAFRAIFGSITLGSFTFYNSAFNRSWTAIRKIFEDLSILYEDNLYLNDLFEFFELPETSFEKDSGQKIKDEKLEIKIENLSFKYPDSKKLVLNKLNMVLKPGESIALVGKNGAGKTTLVKLLCGLYTPTSGRILVNNRPLETLDLEAYRRQIGIVFQDFSYYQFTAAENIGFGKLEELNNQKKIVVAAKKAGAHDFIEHLPKGYRQLIGKQFEGGINLSVGQLQRLALARAFMADPPLMILDEPTSASDAEAEAKLYEHIEKIAEEKSLLLISHRFSTVKIAHKIYVIDKGKIIEFGSHDQLLKKNGAYAKLYKIQAKGYKD